MINLEKLKPILSGYKEYFPTHWEDEKYKWEAVKHFQDHWDIKAENFGEMFKKATEKTSNLLASGYTYPRRMIQFFAEADDAAVRKMFDDLYTESVDLAARIQAFQETAEMLRAKYDDGSRRNHYQSTNAISTYLWLKFPDKYYIYKYELLRAAAIELSSDYMPKRNGSADNVIGGFRLYDEICEAAASDSSIKEMIQKAIAASPSCYEDPEFKTATIDIGFYLARFYLAAKPNDAEWFPKEYSPGLSADVWAELLKDTSVFTQSSLQIMKCMKDYGGQATCMQLSVKYGESVNFYNRGSSSLARRVAESTGCNLFSNDESENNKWWPILYVGKEAGKDEDGSFVWKLRPELSEALDKTDLSAIELYAKEPDSESKKKYWWLTANPKHWSFSLIKVGEEQSYTLYNDNGNKRRIFQNFLNARVGDAVICYEANPVKKVVAIGRITQASDGEAIYFQKTEGLTAPIEYQTLKEAPELEKMEFFVQPNGSLFKLTKGEFDFIMDVIREENPVKQPGTAVQKYTKADFLSKVFMTPERYDVLEALLRNKKNVILQGAPGVGKTFTAKKLAYAMMGEVDESRIEMVQFHQNYSYEDFIMGYRPDGAEFKLTDGIFYRFCQTAANHPEKEYFFIIDEINRGNMSKIFGELLMLIEKDYRGTSATLAYTGIPFSVPENLYIIGMMNTADRSLAMIDYALRRRFSFFEMEPGFDSDGFTDYQKSFANETFDALIDQIKLLNKEIADDKSLGRGFRIGHSYFCGRETDGCTDEWMRSVVEFDILPMLSEYWFDEPAKLQHWENNLHSVFDD
ncbi:MAG: EVE domain-containing protein [Lachnospiraceae bacterium]|nr:EVE domain-containing protein [Lachnospiraceae bacterium]